MTRLEPSLSDWYPTARWGIWYQDAFDRECSPSVDIEGQGLLNGLMELWARYLFETVQADGTEGFSHFHLKWEQGRVSIGGDWEGSKKLREWIYGTKRSSLKGYVAEAQGGLLEHLAAMHARLVHRQGASERILATAAASPSPEQFLRMIG